LILSGLVCAHSQRDRSRSDCREPAAIHKNMIGRNK
jgi:hypothetical protein